MKAAVLGTGNMGGHVVSHLLACPEVQQIVAYDPSPSARDAVSEPGRVEATDDLDTVLADPEVALCFVTCPNQYHADLTRRCIEHGKAVLCEKPLATTLEDAEQVVKFAEARGAFLQVGFELRYSHLYTRVKQWIDEGLLGQVVNTNCTYICTDFCGADSWRTDPTISGSMFGEKLSHYVDLPRWWIGGQVAEVYSLCAPNAIQHYRVRDNYQTTYRFEGGAVSHLSFMMAPAGTVTHDPLAGWSADLKEVGHELRFLIQGTDGAAATDVYGRRLQRWSFEHTSERLVSTLVEDVTWPTEENERYYHNTYDQTRDVVQRVAEGLPPRNAAFDALETMRLCFAAEQSAEIGESISLAKAISSSSLAGLKSSD